MADPIKLGIAGLGTVGAGLIKIVQNNLSILEAR
jgi:homoserine dehydrogenase